MIVVDSNVIAYCWVNGPLTALAQNTPRVVFMQRIHVTVFLVVLWLGSGRTGNVRGPAELLPWRILHAEDPIKRHRLDHNRSRVATA